jgi:hypothetical protein
MKILIIRTAENEKQTIGTGLVFDNLGRLLYQFASLELPYLANSRKISCIPVGNYKIVKRRSERYGTHFHIQDVAKRDLILMHVGNYHFNSSGCILVGREHKDINQDNLLDVVNSTVTMRDLLRICPENLELEIIKFNV